jgi:hypothetical protein
VRGEGFGKIPSGGSPSSTSSISAQSINSECQQEDAECYKVTNNVSTIAAV